MGYFNIIKLNATTSTNDYLKQRRLAGEGVEGDFVWTTHQTQGRGQGSKTWESEANTSLSLSVFRDFGGVDLDQPFAISSAFATAVIRALTLLELPDLNIKWPNDILSCNQKIGGILIENTFSNHQLNTSIIGLGLNVNQSTLSQFPHAGSFFSLTKKKWSIEKVVEALLQALEAKEFLSLERHQQSNLAEFNSFLWRKGKRSTFQGAEGIFEAIPTEVTAEGKLIVTLPENERKKELVLAEARMQYNQI
jgi:BirA family biotin operon repressor/biotin-[acetyl-CoA-carboxylase] ligase